MNPTRILPDLQCSLLCEEVRQEVTGNFFLVGVINFIRVPQVPVVAFKLALFNRWTAGKICRSKTGNCECSPRACSPRMRTAW